MFNVTFFVDDKKLGEVLASLTGKVMNLDFKHMSNVKVTGGRVVAKSGAGTITEAVYQQLTKQKGPFTHDVVRAMMEELGGSANSAANFVATGVKKKLFKKVGSGKYTITRR